MTKLILRIAFVIFFIEVALMVAFSHVAFIPETLLTWIDATFLVAGSTPILYLWVIKPYIDACDQSEAALIKSKERLEFLVAENPAVIYTVEVACEHPVTYVGKNVEQVLGYVRTEDLQKFVPGNVVGEGRWVNFRE